MKGKVYIVGAGPGDAGLLALKALDLVDVEAAAGHDLHVLEALAIEGAPDQLTELRVDPSGVEVTHQLLDADVDHRLGGVQAHAP